MARARGPGGALTWPLASSAGGGCGPTGNGGGTCFSSRTTFESVAVALTRPTASIARIWYW